jgi:DNA-binding NarL/FixJ family response regulator
MNISMLIVEPEEIVRKGIIACIQPYFPHGEFFESSSTEEAKKCLRKEKINLIISEIAINSSSGFEILQLNIKREIPLKTIVLTSKVQREYILAAKQLGANGYFSKNISPELLAESIKRVMLSNLFTSNEWFADNYNENSSFVLRTIDLLKNLSKRELKTLELFCQGLNTKEVSEIMHVQKKSVDNYKNRIAKKMELPPEIYFREWIKSQGEFIGSIISLNSTSN